MRVLKITLCCCLFFNFCLAQELARKGSLGAVVRSAEGGGAIQIGDVLDQSTAEALGIKSGDVILSINDKTFTQTQDLIAYTSTWRAGEAMSVSVSRNGKTILLKGKVKGKPLETSEFAEVIYDAIPFKEGMLRSILELPKGVENPPVLFFLQGFSCSSIDFYYNPASPIKQLTEGLVERGIAVFRVEKPGVGDCINLSPCEEIGYKEEVKAFSVALKVLKKMEAIDAENIFLFGHSLGGVTAPLLAEQTPVKGIVNYGSVSTTWYEYLLKVLREQEVLQGRDYETVETNVRRRAPILHDYLVNKRTPEELAANPAYAPYLSSGLPLLNGDYAVGRHYTFMQEINDVNITRALKNAGARFLAIHGEFDLHAVDYEWAEDMAAIVNAYHPGKGEWKILKGTEHAFAKVGSMEENVRLRRQGLLNGAYMSEHFNSELTKMVGEWIWKTIG